ncbi:MAG: uroporphyrinogen-III synthase [Leadbetterella sp.]
MNLDARIKKVESILITLENPGEKSNTYSELTTKYGVRVDFRNFIDVRKIDHRDFRNQKIDILAHTAVVFTSKHAVDHFFKLAEEIRVEIPADMKYFCVTEQTANYLQKYITIRKRKIFAGNKTAADLEPFFIKNKNEKFLFPCSNIRNDSVPTLLNKLNISLTEAIMYETVPANLSDLTEVFYDVICFFSPSGVNSLVTNFPDWRQNNTRLAAFGPTTAKAIRDLDLILDIEAPLPNAPSMVGALEQYIKKANNL